MQKRFAQMGFVLRHRVLTELERAKVDSTNVVVHVERTTLIVEGELNSASDCVAIIAILRNIPGVREVVDRLQVRAQHPPNERGRPRDDGPLFEVMEDYFGKDQSWRS